MVEEPDDGAGGDEPRCLAGGEGVLCFPKINRTKTLQKPLKSAPSVENRIETRTHHVGREGLDDVDRAEEVDGKDLLRGSNLSSN